MCYILRSFYKWQEHDGVKIYENKENINVDAKLFVDDLILLFSLAVFISEIKWQMFNPSIH